MIIGETPEEYSVQEAEEKITPQKDLIQEAEEKITPQEFARRMDGRRIIHHDPSLNLPSFDYQGVQEGYVVDGNLDDEVWANIRSLAIPLKPGGMNFFERRKALGFINRTTEAFGEEALIIMTPDSETMKGWAWHPVPKSDLFKDAETLEREMSEALKKRDLALESRKRHAYFLVTGNSETK